MQREQFGRVSRNYDRTALTGWKPPHLYDKGGSPRLQTSMLPTHNEDATSEELRKVK